MFKQSLTAFVILALLCSTRLALAVTATDFLYGSYTDVAADGTTPYRYFVPTSYNAANKYPIVLFLHGVGENGNDNVKQLNNRANGAMVFAEQAQNPAFMIAPQNWNGASGWQNDVLRRHILGMIQRFQAQYNIDASRIYVCGLSNGGAGTWDQLNTYPWLYAAGVPASGWGSATDNIKDIPAWCFHCADDPTVNVSGGDNIIAGLRNLGGNPIYTRYATGGHGSWVPAYQNQTMINWMFAQRRGQRDWTNVPALRITSPTTNKGYATNLTSINVSGSATDMLPADTTTTGITGVTWTNTHGSVTDSGTATGNTTWAASPITLAAGLNRIRILATGTSFSSGNGGNTTFTDILYANSTTTADTTAPVITISQPATSPITVTTATYTMHGAVSDAGTVVDWTWSSNNGFTGNCSSGWPVPLLNGSNVITVTAIDAAGNTATKSVTIIYSPLTGNQPPVVSAGYSQAVVLPSLSVNLAGTVTDDTGTPTVSWSKVSGPGTVSFSNGSSVNTTATFSSAGSYILRLSANDGQYTSTDDVVVAVGYKRWLYDFGAAAITTSGNWNNVTNVAAGTVVTGSLDSNGAATSVGLALLTGFTGVNSNGTTTATLYPASAQEDSFYVQAAALGQIQLTGLNPSATYQFTFFASRSTFDDRTTEYTIGSTKVTLDPVDNTTRSAYIASVVPNSSGVVQLTVDADNGTGYGYIGVLDIVQLTNPSGTDTVAPAIAITAPTTNATFATTVSAVNLAGTASDNVGVTQVTWSNDRGGSGTATGTTLWSISNIVLLSGANVLTVTAHDAAGNVTTKTLTVTYTIPDTIAPSISITMPTGNATFATTTATVNLAGTASDNIGVAQVTWSNNRGGSGTAAGTTSWSVSNVALLSGANIVTVTAHDAAGNTAVKTLTITYTIPDTTAPSLTISTPTANAAFATSSASINLAGAASDNVSVTQVTWMNDRGGSGTASGTSAWTVTNVDLLSGKNVLTVSARDAAGNIGKAVLTVTYTPNSPPTIGSVSASPNEQALVGDPIAFSAAASDPDGNVLSYAWDFGDGFTGSGATLSHAYSAPGTYTSTVTVNDGLGGSANASVTVSVIAITSIKINFQMVNSTTPAGYLADSGAVFADRGNGFSYGWNVDNSINARDRNAANSPDQRYDTFIHMQKPNAPTAAWEIAVPNGTYTVRAICGDPSYFDSVYSVNIENVLTVQGTPSAATKWFEGTQTIVVSDGRLTISSATGAVNNKLNFVEIMSASPLPKEVASDVPSAEALVVSKLLLRTNFARKGSDSYQVSGSIATLPTSSVVKGAHVSVDVGAAIVDFVLDDKGRAKSKNGTLRLTLNTKKTWSFQVAVKSGQWVSDWADGGVANTTIKAESLEIPVTFTIDGHTYGGSKKTLFTSHAMRSGIAK